MKENIQSKLKEAMRERNQVRMDTLRGLITAIQYEEIHRAEKGGTPPTDQDYLEVLKREVKKRKEEVEFAEKASRQDLLDKLKIEIMTIEEFLPKQLSVAELEVVVKELRSSTTSIDMGGLMKLLKEKYAGQYDGKAASEVVKKVLQG